MSALTDYLLAKHAISLRQEPIPAHYQGESLGKTLGEVGRAIGRFFVRVYRAVANYIDDQATQHNQMRNARENWNGQKDGVYIRGLF